ncbi:uncharacterized protein LOC582782 [Strongylocentrotus purpuratus]|uniref:Uncharacterized protein n=1 Tax=Strongylocentrotus purpuratus TaxID=7668 RepID=A0A7M7RGW4_STRPU|nr:uncharacterized protein LOC582782 [Strongylocentrotus purpuratus]
MGSKSSKISAAGPSKPNTAARDNVRKKPLIAKDDKQTNYEPSTKKRSKQSTSKKKGSIVIDEYGRRTSTVTKVGTKTTRTRKKTLDPLNYKGEEMKELRYKHAKKEKGEKTSKKRKGNDDDDDDHIALGNDVLSETPCCDDDEDTINLIQYENFEYPFENIVFEGGGNKGLAYAGAVREFERIGLWTKIRRFGGASAGAMWAALLAVGYNSNEVEEFLSMNLKDYFLDASCGTCSLFPNLRRHFGWHPARRLFEWFGDRLEDMTGDADITFSQLYTRTGKELCIVVTNLSQMSAEYCHAKTTPNLPIRMAVRMSIAIPGLFGAVRSKGRTNCDVYVDGGVLCNYPIHCFDGWWLSMKPADSMLRRLQPLEDIGRLWDRKERFGTTNPHTVGLFLYTSDEQDVMVDKLAKREASMPPQELPATKLAGRRNRIKKKREEETRKHALVTAAMSGFLKLLSEIDINQNSIISRDELKDAFSKNPPYFNAKHRKDLFGNDMTVDEIFDNMDHNADDEITFDELQAFAEERGVGIQANFQGYGRKEINGLSDFLGTLQETLLVNVKRIFVTEGDVNRTLGIDTVYVDTTDFVLEAEDKEFLIQQGVRGVQAFLRYYVRQNDPPLKASLRGPNDTRSTVMFDDLHR